MATWWCGEASALDYVIQHLDELVIKPAYPSQRMNAVFGNRLSATDKASWIGRLRAGPQLPSWTAENLSWLGRYGERVENSARQFRLMYDALIDEGEAGGLLPALPPSPTDDGRLRTAIANCELFGLLPPANGQSIAQRLIAGVQDESWPNSLLNVLRATLWAATQARDQLSLDHTGTR